MPRTALVSGGSGAVGNAVVRRFIADGYQVAFTFRTGEGSAQQLATDTGALAVRADLLQRSDVEAAVETAMRAFEHVDVLVNNAGATQVMPFALVEEEDWDHVIDANLKTMYMVTHELARHMIRRKSGAIVNVGSLAGQRILDVPVHYATAKAGVTGFTLSLARELARYGIRVNEVVPGLLDAGVGDLVPDKERKDYLAHCMAGRAGRPEEVAAVIAFLAGDDASYVNGQSIHVDGGI